MKLTESAKRNPKEETTMAQIDGGCPLRGVNRIWQTNPSAAVIVVDD